MRINSNDNQGYIIIKVGEIGIDESICFIVDATYSGFSGKHSRIWIEENQFKDFLTDLEQLEKNRNGSASIQSISPDEFHLMLYSLDSLGHIGLTLSLKKATYISSRTVYQKTEISFEIDASCFIQIVENFNDIIIQL